MNDVTREGGGFRTSVTMCDVGGWGRFKCCDITQGRDMGCLELPNIHACHIQGGPKNGATDSSP